MQQSAPRGERIAGVAAFFETAVYNPGTRRYANQGEKTMMNRREMLASAAGVLPAWLLFSSTEKTSPMGVAEFSFNFRLRSERAKGDPDGLGDPLNFLEYCHQIGAGGIQKNLGVRDEAYCRKIRDKAQQYGMYVEGSAGLPHQDSQAERFEANVRSARQSGAQVIRTAMGGRRYEVFDTLEQYNQWAAVTEKAVQRAEPILAKHKVHLAIENHKDRLAEEMLAMLKRIDSQYVGLCVDTGNDLALLGDPMEAVRAYAPWARSVHVKDAATAEYEEGFLLADAVLGEGVLDLPEMAKILREANPDVRFTLEMSTRDPLLVPCLTEKYWATLQDVGGRDLARTLRTIRSRSTSKASLPRAERLAQSERIELEEENVKKCLAYARDRMGI